MENCRIPLSQLIVIYQYFFGGFCISRYYSHCHILNPFCLGFVRVRRKKCFFMCWNLVPVGLRERKAFKGYHNCWKSSAERVFAFSWSLWTPPLTADTNRMNISSISKWTFLPCILFAVSVVVNCWPLLLLILDLMRSPWGVFYFSPLVLRKIFPKEFWLVPKIFVSFFIKSFI